MYDLANTGYVTNEGLFRMFLFVGVTMQIKRAFVQMSRNRRQSYCFTMFEYFV